MPDDPTSLSNTFKNVVVFCTKNADRPLTFRKGTPADWLGSFARRDFVPPASDLEIKLADIRGQSKWKETEILRRGEEAKIEKFHREAAVKHWAIMRTVLPDKIWETW